MMPPGGPPMPPGAMPPQQVMPPPMPAPQQQPAPPPATAGFATDQNIQANFLPALAIIKDPRKRKFRIDIESDSMIVIDEQQEKQSRVEFLTGSGTFLENALSALAKVPPQLAAPLVPLIMEMLLFGVRGFKAGRDMETTFETAKAQLLQAIQGMQAQAAQPQPPPPDPKAQAQAAAIQATTQARIQGEQARMQAQTQNDARKSQAEIQRDDAKAVADIQRQAALAHHGAGIDAWQAQQDAALAAQQPPAGTA